MARVIVLGAGIVGMNAAAVLRKKLDARHAVALGGSGRSVCLAPFPVSSRTPPRASPSP